MFAYGIFKVLYSPIEAFKEIVKKPTYKAPILILIVVLLITAGANCISTREIFTPDEDEWTESDSLWHSNGNIKLDSTDYVTGKHSVSSFISNAAEISMNVKGIGPVNCTENEGYKKLIFLIKWINQNRTFDSTLRLFSGENSSFEQDVTGLVSNVSDQWNKVTLDVGLESENWNKTDSPNWKNITGFEIQLTWSCEEKNITMKIDGVSFGGRYIPAIESEDFGYRLAESLMGTGMNLFFNWIIFTGTLFLIIKLYGGKAGSFKLLFNIVGYVLSTFIVIDLIWVILILINVSSSILLLLISLAFHIWSVALYAVATHTLHEFTWKSSVTASVTAYIFGLTLINLLFIF